MRKDAIGVFDSGIGGLSVVKQIMHHLPHENIIYFGDIARIPYGTKSVDTINKFTSETVEFLLRKKVKVLVIACNTITAVAYNTVKKLAVDIPVIDVISGATSVVASNPLYKKIGVIATPATIKSNAYQNAIHQINNNIEVISQACPLLVPLIEEGLINHKALELIAIDYLDKFTNLDINALILGCTHYPLISDILQKIIGGNIDIIDPAIRTAIEIRSVLEKHKLLNHIVGNPVHQFYVTDNPDRFKHIGELFLNCKLYNVELLPTKDL